MAKPKHHTVPVTYLRAFAAPFHRRRKVWIFDLEKGEWRAQAPEKVSSERGFYRLSEDVPVNAEWVETEFFGKIETAYGPVARKLRLGDFNLSPAEHKALLNFVAALYVRTGPRREAARRRAAEMGETWLEYYRANPAKWEKLKAEATAAGAIDDELARYAVGLGPAEAGELKFDMSKDVHVVTMMDAWMDIVQLFRSRNWAFGRVPDWSMGTLVTSDDPVSTYCMGADNSLIYRSPVTSPDTGFLVPVGPYLALFGEDSIEAGAVRDLADFEIARINAATLIPDRRFAYSATKYFRWYDEGLREELRAWELPARCLAFADESRSVEKRYFEQNNKPELIELLESGRPET